MSRHWLPALSGWLQALRALRHRRTSGVRGRLGAPVVAGVATRAATLPSPRGSAPEDGPGVPIPMGQARLADASDGLRRLLDRHVATRAVWPSLALVERAMARHGWAGVDRMSPQVLHDASRVLDELTDERCESGVIVLRARMAALLDALDDDPSVPRPRYKARRPVVTQVREGSFTEFMEIDREWEQQVRAATPVAAPSR